MTQKSVFCSIMRTKQAHVSYLFTLSSTYGSRALYSAQPVFIGCKFFPQYLSVFNAHFDIILIQKAAQLNCPFGIIKGVGLKP